MTKETRETVTVIAAAILLGGLALWGLSAVAGGVL